MLYDMGMYRPAAKPTPTPPTPADPAITYGTTSVARYKGQSYNVYNLNVMNPDGTKQTQLLKGAVNPGSPWHHGYLGPSLAPDGMQLVVSASMPSNAQCNEQSGYLELHVVTFDTTPKVTNVRTLTDCNQVVGGPDDKAGAGQHPTWSPDGSRIAFSVHSERSIRTIPATGTNNSTIVYSTVAPYRVQDMTWSHDSTKIAFVLASYPGSPIRPEYSLHVLDVATGVDTTIVPEGNYVIAHPDWSRDGGLIAFPAASRITPDGIHLYTLDPLIGMSSIVQIPTTKEPQGGLSWLPDDSGLIFNAYVSPTWSIEQLILSTQTQTQLASSSNFLHGPDRRR